MSLSPTAPLSSIHRSEADQPTQTAVALQSRAALLELILDGIPQCVFWKDANSVYLGCNRQWATVIGIADPAAIVGKTEYDLPSPSAGLIYWL